LNLPYPKRKKVLRIKLHINWDPTDVSYKWNFHKILNIKQLCIRAGCSEEYFNTVIKLIHRHDIIGFSEDQLQERIMALWRMRQQLTHIPVNKIIQNFVTYSTKQQVNTLIVLIAFHEHEHNPNNDTYGHLVNVL